MPLSVCQALVTSAPQCSASTPRGQKPNCSFSVGSDSGTDLLNIVVGGNPVDLVESFTYLGSIQTSDGYLLQVGHHTSNWPRVLSNVVTQ